MWNKFIKMLYQEKINDVTITIKAELPYFLNFSRFRP